MLIEEGMVITNCEGEEVKVESITKGQYGLLLNGTFLGNHECWRLYVIPELVPGDRVQDWYNWRSKPKFLTPFRHS